MARPIGRKRTRPLAPSSNHCIITIIENRLHLPGPLGDWLGGDAAVSCGLASTGSACAHRPGAGPPSRRGPRDPFGKLDSHSPRHLLDPRTGPRVKGLPLRCHVGDIASRPASGLGPDVGFVGPRGDPFPTKSSLRILGAWSRRSPFNLRNHPPCRQYPPHSRQSHREGQTRRAQGGVGRTVAGKTRRSHPRRSRCSTVAQFALAHRQWRRSLRDPLRGVGRRPVRRSGFGKVPPGPNRPQGAASTSSAISACVIGSMRAACWSRQAATCSAVTTSS